MPAKVIHRVEYRNVGSQRCERPKQKCLLCDASSPGSMAIGVIRFGDLEKPLWIAIVDGCSRHFAIEYRLIVQINTRWGVAPSDHATPRELLMSFGLNPAEYSLYAIDGKDPLPPDTPLNLRRGERFEAQKDGRYGAPATTANGL